MSPIIGNKVKFLNENLEGEVKAIYQKGTILVEASNGFEYELSINEVIVVNNDNTHSYLLDKNLVKDKIKIFKPDKAISEGFLGKYTTTTKYQFEKIIEIDLHLEELVEFPMRLDDWQRLHTQMSHAKKCLNAAFNQKIRKLVFIHGVGTGVLKTELHNYLAGFENISFKDADCREYGSGATEVFIKK
jgi:hypothetical protein